MTKLLLLGDTHGMVPSLARAINLAGYWELDAIFQVGDFGYWPQRGKSGDGFIDTAVNSPVPVYWLPGNHEDWDAYEAVLESTWDQSDDALVAQYGNPDFDADGFRVIDSMHISPKVHSWTWDGLRFGALGGAYSVDQSLRTKGKSWFPQEQPQFEDVDLLPDKLDILFTHEAPINLAEAHGWNGLPKAWKIDKVLSSQSQAVIAHAAWKTTPGLLVHGHWHIRMNYYFNDTFVQGLDQASSADIDCMMVLDTEKRALYDLYQYKVEGTRSQWQAS